MTRGKPIPEDTQWIIIRLHTVMAADDIATFTDVSLRRVNAILSHFRQTGGVKTLSRGKPQLHRSLCDYDTEVRSLASQLTVRFD